jgi:hypothetical protein
MRLGASESAAMPPDEYDRGLERIVVVEDVG